MKCLITGANGHLAKELQRIGKRHDIKYVPMVGHTECDISDASSVAKYIYNHSDELFDIEKVIHCAAYTNVPGAELNRKQAIETNIIGTKNIISEICDFGVTAIYISTDYVYSGIMGNYKETDSTSPVNFYALTKLAGESYAGPDDLIIRTSFKPLVWQHPVAFSDLYTSADYIDVIAKKISFLILHDAQGIYNVGTERKSIYELAVRKNKHISPISRLSIKGVRLPEDVSMNTEKYDAFYNEIVGGNNGRK